MVIPAGIVPLKTWFKDLLQMAPQHDGILIQSAKAASELLETTLNSGLLHGDIHHENVLQSSLGQWLAIDPHSLNGERGFDYANIFCNPEQLSAIAIQRLPERLNIVVQKSGIGKKRLLQWILAWDGLSASWFLMDDLNDGKFQLEVAEIVNRMLMRL